MKFKLDEDLLILGKGSVCGKTSLSIKTKQDIPGYDGEIVWTVASHSISDADGYLALHNEDLGDRPEIKKSWVHYSLCGPCTKGVLVNNSISALILHGASVGFKKIRIAGCPMAIRTEYEEQRESMFMAMGYAKSLGVEVTWDNDNADYVNYYTKALAVTEYIKK